MFVPLSNLSAIAKKSEPAEVYLHIPSVNKVSF